MAPINEARRLKTSVIWAFTGQSVKLLLQMGYFVLLARMLQPREYGAFVAVAAFANSLGAFSGMGSGHVLIREVSRDRSRFADSFGSSLFAHFIFGNLLLLGTLCGARIFFPADLSLEVVGYICVADLICARLVDLGVQSFQAVDQIRWMAILQMGGTLCRIFAVLYLISFPHPTVRQWAALYVASSLVSAAGAVLLVAIRLAWPSLRWRNLRPTFVSGFHFATSQSAETIYNDLDKTMLAKLSTPEAAAIYAVAYRFIEAATVPIRSLAMATYAQFFAEGSNGIEATYRYAKRLMPKSVLYGIAAGAGLYLMAPLFPHFMGPSYQASVTALRWLAPLPAIRGIHAFLVNVLTGADRQPVRTTIQWSIALFNVLINLWVIRAYAWKGAALSSLASDALLAAGLHLTIVFLLNRRHTATVPVAVTQFPNV